MQRLRIWTEKKGWTLVGEYKFTGDFSTFYMGPESIWIQVD